jgi:hypothetical protein
MLPVDPVPDHMGHGLPITGTAWNQSADVEEAEYDVTAGMWSHATRAENGECKTRGRTPAGDTLDLFVQCPADGA